MRYVPLFGPFALAFLLQDYILTSYGVAWVGSFFILWITISGRIKPLPGGYPARFQLFRPIVFTQLVFAGYTALTSIFYIISVSHGVDPSDGIGLVRPSLELAAQAQRYYVLAHASVALGMLLFMDYSDSGRYRVTTKTELSRVLAGIAALFFVLGMSTALLPGLAQISGRLREVAVAASVFSFALSLINKEGLLVGLNAAVFGANMVTAMLSGWKEEVLVLLLLFFVMLYPYYRKTTITVGVFALAIFVAVMPAYSIIYRQMAWYGRQEPTKAMKTALEQVRSGRISLTGAAETFATGRLSEIGLFVGYIRQVPSRRPYYGGAIIVQTGQNLIPRFAWPEKPNTENLVMERVFENNIYGRASIVSAKPQYVVDGYLTAGAIGILVAGILYGVLATAMSRLAERWFGGYLMGSGLVYSALFQIFWRGNSFEFFFGTIFWSALLMFGLFQAGRAMHFLVPAQRGPAPRARDYRGAQRPSRPLEPVQPFNNPKAFPRRVT